jgi:cytoskeleton protein RodZ
MTAIGETLRRERVRRNLELQQISRELKISARFLDALEREAFDELPGAIFVKSFVRQYARLLGLDEDELAAEAQRIMEPVVEEPPARTHSMAAVENVRVPPMRAWRSVGDGDRFQWRSILPALGLVVAVMLVCSGVYAWWQRERHAAAVSAARPAGSTRPAPPPSEAAAVPASAATPAPPDAGASQALAAPSGPSTEAQPAPADAAEPQSAAPPANALPAGQTEPSTEPPVVEQPSERATAPSAQGPVRVQVTALETSWVRARSDGKYVFSATLDPNQTRTVEASESVELLLGNAGGVSVALNGKPIGALGPKGQVRTVQLSSGGFRIVSAKAPAPAPADPL